MLILAQWVVGVVSILIAILSVGIFVLNATSAVVALIWLTWLGMWSEIKWGIGLMVVGGLGLGLLMAPASAFALAAGAWMEKKLYAKVLVPIFTLLSALCVIAALTLWCFNVLLCFVYDATGQTLAPLLLWSYGVAMLPIMMILGADQGNKQAPSAGFTAFFINLAYIVVMLQALWEQRLEPHLAWTFATIMFAGFIFIELYTYVEEKEKQVEDVRDYD